MVAEWDERGPQIEPIRQSHMLTSRGCGPGHCPDGNHPELIYHIIIVKSLQFPLKHTINTIALTKVSKYKDTCRTKRYKLNTGVNFIA